MANENTSLQTRAPAQSPANNIRALIEHSKPKLAEVMPRHLTPERLTRVAIAAITRTPKLLECTPASLLQSVMQAAELGLEPGSALGEAYLVPFYDNKQKAMMCQLIPGYRGLIALARRSGQIEDIEAHVVREGDIFHMSKGIDQVLEHVPNFDGNEPAALRLVYAMAWLKGSKRPHVEVMTRAEIDKIKAKSKAKDFGPWVDHYDEMARKTVVRRLVKYLPMSVEMARAHEIEQGEVLDADAMDVTEAAPPAKASGFKGRVIEAAAHQATAPEMATPDGRSDPSTVEGERVPGGDDEA